MKKSIIFFLSAASLLALNTSGSSKYSYNKASLIVCDTLPQTDTMGEGNWQHNQLHKTTPMSNNDTSMHTHKDSISKMPPL